MRQDVLTRSREVAKERGFLLRSTEKQSPVYGKQLLTYLRLMNLPLGLLMNFGVGTFKEGVQRVVSNHV